ncbi:MULTISPECIES: BTAD domain-containing putative transcriptional regulator [Protofrankia]|uniref:Histidine kinase n=1 Tax=Protofrankia coriariae TaxID=1562887 RepID=A0ABR5F1H2_9ACTN|nr:MULTISPECIES: BTAD domain-containing putative transcriptional regulator [Protofrankia]KLL10569.1 histidine kinase [Protofrankia coriariae]ONH34133.1 hypothetical protein BL254_17615 [Protofrankia sp. BMG5.30]
MSRPVASTPRPFPRRLAAGGLALGRIVRAAVALVALIALIGGLPWGLWHFVGWPLPDHLPSWAEIETRLTGPMDDGLLLNILACLLWPLWAAFTASVVLTVPDVLREARGPTYGSSLPAGGMRGFAAFLLGAVLLTALSPRLPLASDGGPAVATVVATGPVTPRLVPASTMTDITPPVAAPGTVVVQAPHGGIHDSLWRIAARCLGDGARWPELWAVNQGVVQADGRTLTRPQLIHPGWVLRLPAEAVAPGSPGRPPVSDPPPPVAHAATAPPHTPSPTSPPPAMTSPGGATTSPSATSPSAAGGPTAIPPPSVPSAVPSTPASPAVASAPASPAVPPPQQPAPAPPHAPGVAFPSGGYLGLGAVALLTVALFTLRLWRRRHYTPGSGQRDDLDEAPVIRHLAIAYDAATALPDEHGDPVVVRSPGDRHVAGRRHAQATAAHTAPPPGTQVVGTTRDGRPLALDLAATRGLGLIGPGADAAIRALLLALLAERHRPDTDPVEILIPAADAIRLLGEQATAHPPQRLHIVPDLDTLLDRLEAEIVTRARLAAHGTPTAHRATLVAVATPTPAADGRLQAVLDNGSSLGLAGILYGQWRAGATVRVRPDGVVGAASPTIAARLTGSRLFTLPPVDAAQLLELLADADAPADNQEAYRRANPTQGPPPPPPASASPPANTSPAAPDSPHDGDRHAHPQLPEPAQPPPAGPAPTTSASAATPRDSGAPAPAPASVAGPAVSTHRPPPATTPLLLTVLGPLRLLYRPTADADYQPIDGVGPKAREILAYLALHPDGVRRDTLVTALWPDDGESSRRRLDNRFYAALSQLRRALRTATTDTIDDIVVHHDGRYHLHRDLLSVDLWQLQDALAQRHHATTAADRFAALLPITATYTGHLSDDLTGAWAEPHREHLRRQVADALASLTATIGEDNPQRLELLEVLRQLDPYNEQLYRQIARAQARLGHPDAVSRTYALLTACLADIDQQPTTDTTAFFHALQRQQPDPRNTRSAS